MKLIADDSIPFLRGIPEQFAEVEYLPLENFTHDHIRDADVLIIRSTNKCTRQLLENTRVRFIASATIGFDHIDIDYCKEAGIQWTNAPGCNAVSVGQYMMAALIELSRKKNISLYDKVFGIVGVGNVGKEVEKMYRAYGLRYLKCDPPRAKNEGSGAFVSLNELAETCDIISFHVPLTHSGECPTYHIADRSFFRSLRRKPYIINVARGAVHHTEALLEAKRTGLIEDMLLDCWEDEPDISRTLLDEALIATPHIAGFSADGKANGSRMCLEAISKEFGIEIPDLYERTQPLPPQQPVIDLNRWKTNRVEETILTTFSPLNEDIRLRANSDRFEYLRTHYDNPREFSAYTILHATEEESRLLKALGFQ